MRQLYQKSADKKSPAVTAGLYDILRYIRMPLFHLFRLIRSPEARLPYSRAHIPVDTAR
ncbi:MAG: hypothetical protein AAB533_03975 [Patescibacteria group bacterium]